VPLDPSTRRAPRESHRARSLYTEGIIRQIRQLSRYARGDCILFEAAPEGEVRDALAALPLMQAGMLELLWVIPLRPAPALQKVVS
jgi:muconolactone delta-isomerase